jgi:hypothetical protein
LKLPAGGSIPFPWQGGEALIRSFLAAFPGRPGPVFNQRANGWQVVIVSRLNRYHILHHDPDARLPIANVSCPRSVLDAQIPSLMRELAVISEPAPEAVLSQDR